MTIRLIHYQNKYTVACECDDITDIVKYFAVSACGPHDQFSKKMGRIKAEGRLKSSKFKINTNDASLKFSDFKKLVFNGDVVLDYPRMKLENVQ